MSPEKKWRPLAKRKNDAGIQDSWQPEPGGSLRSPYAEKRFTGIPFSIAPSYHIVETGKWIIGPRHISIATVGGSTCLDLREATFTDPEVTIVAIAFLAAGIDIIVPPELNVVVTGNAIAAHFGWARGEHEQPTTTAATSGPTLTVKGVGILAWVNIIRCERGEIVQRVRTRAGHWVNTRGY